jgi:outer membrane protein TolC
MGQEVLTWQDCVREAARNNPDLAAAQALVQRAQFQHQGSRSPFLPQLSLDAQYNQTHSSTNGDLFTNGSSTSDEYSLGLSVRQSLFTGFRNKAEVDRTRAVLEAAEADLSAVKAEVSFDLKSAFTQVLFAQEQLTLAEVIAARRKGNVNLVELRYEAGREHKGSFLRSQAAYHRAQFEVEQAKRAIKVAQRELARVLGRREFDGIKVGGSFEVALPPAPPDFRTLAERTPARQKPLAEARAAESAVTVAQAPFFPEIAATGSVFRLGSDFPPDQNQWSAGVLLTLPLFSGGQNYFGLQDARAEYRRAQENLRSAEDQVVLDLEQTFADFKDSVERTTVQRDFLNAAEVRAEITRSLYTSGLLSFDDWDLIENDLIGARKEMLVNLRDQLIAEGDWERAQGSGSIP